MDHSVEIQQLKQELRKIDDIMTSLFAIFPMGLLITDEDGRLKRVNPAAGKIIGYTEDQVTGKSLAELFHENHSEEALRRYRLASEGEMQTFSSALLLQSGYPLEVMMTMMPSAGQGRKSDGVIALFEDISQNRLTEERIKHMAYYDDLTGLPNRRQFRDLIEEYLAAAEDPSQVCVVVLNINRFKQVNGSLGQDIGDMVLLQVADRIHRSVIEEGIAARLEGDEFGILFRASSGAVCTETLVERIRNALVEPFSIQEYNIHISVSMGIAVGAAGKDSPTMLRMAGIALSKAKEQGENSVAQYTHDLDDIYFWKFQLENDLRIAIQQGQFHLVYQPQYHIATGKIVGTEVLLRWRHPERGMIPPNEFIPLAEETGLIVPISEWVIREACLQNRAWQKEGLPAVPVAVNLSVRYFMQRNVAEQVAEILRETELDPSYLELEITETMMMDVEYATSALAKFKELGVRISVDDFGTGYSSLNYLKSLPVDKLKIDRTFVRDILNSSNDAAIVRTIITMGHHLNHTVIAEGVETKEQLQYLRENGCDELQGYIYSPPLSAAEIRECMASSLIPPRIRA